MTVHGFIGATPLSLFEETQNERGGIDESFLSQLEETESFLPELEETLIEDEHDSVEPMPLPDEIHNEPFNFKEIKQVGIHNK